MSKKILVVDDEEKILEMLKSFLEREGFSVVLAADGNAAWDLINSEKPDLVVLDWMLPGTSGLEVCRRLRELKLGVPVIMLTARAEEVDKLLGLELGADDYITKPFSLRELAARIKAVLRRAEQGHARPEEVIVCGELEIDLARHEVRVGGRPVTLTPTEFKILRLLSGNPGRVYSRLQLLEAVFGVAYEGYERSIDTHISNLRKKIEPDPSRPRYILTVYGTGYRFSG